MVQLVPVADVPELEHCNMAYKITGFRSPQLVATLDVAAGVSQSGAPFLCLRNASAPAARARCAQRAAFHSQLHFKT